MRTTSSRITRAAPPTSNSLPVRMGRAGGHSQARQLRSRPARAIQRQGPDLLRRGGQSALPAVGYRAGRGRRPRDARVLLDAYDEDVVENEERIVLRLDPRLAPIKAAVFPLLRKAGQPEKAQEVLRMLQAVFHGRLRPGRFDRPALSAPGRSRHAVRHHDRSSDHGGRHRHAARPRLDRAGSGCEIAALAAGTDRAHRLASLGRPRPGRWRPRYGATFVLTILARAGRGESFPTMARVHPEIYFFGGGIAEGRATMRDLLGGKGANLPEMASLKLPVPPGFTISTRVCTYFYKHGGKYPNGLRRAWPRALRGSKSRWAGKFGDAKNPLLVSVRSGARVSMPGMMDTVLNLGLTDETVKGLEAASKNPRFAWDSYRRFCQMYGDVVLKLKPENKNDPDPFEELIDRKKALRGVIQDVDLTVDDLKELVGEFRDLIRAPRRPGHAAGSVGAVVGGDRRGVRLVAERPRDRLPQDSTTSLTTGAPRSPCSRWCSATSATTAPPASLSPAILPPAKRASTASSCPTRRARTWSRESARRAR